MNRRFDPAGKFPNLCLLWDLVGGSALPIFVAPTRSASRCDAVGIGERHPFPQIDGTPMFIIELEPSPPALFLSSSSPEETMQSLLPNGISIARITFCRSPLWSSTFHSTPFAAAKRKLKWDCKVSSLLVQFYACNSLFFVFFFSFIVFSFSLALCEDVAPAVMIGF